MDRLVICIVCKTPTFCFTLSIKGQKYHYVIEEWTFIVIFVTTKIDSTVEADFSKLFERRKNVYYCQIFTIYHVIYAVIANFGKQQKVY